MLRKRLITVLTINNGVLFRTKHFNPDYRFTHNFVDSWSIDEIILLDITRSGEGDRENFYEMVESFAKTCFVPLAAGGRVSTLEDFRKLLMVGADKVVINSKALQNPDFIKEASKLYGSQCVVVSIDALRDEAGAYEVYSSYGENPTGLNPAEWAKQAEQLGAGELMITSIEKDGSLEGYDNELNRMVSDSVNIPVLVCGGAGKWQDFVDGFNDGGGSAVCTTNIYHFTETSIQSAKNFLKKADINMR